MKTTSILFLLSLPFLALNAQPVVTKKVDVCRMTKQFVNGQLAIEHHYDAQGRISGYSNFKEGVFKEKIAFHTPEKAMNIQEATVVDPQGKATFKFKQEVLPNGLVATYELISIDSTGKEMLERRHLYEYDETAACKLKKISVYNAMGKLLTTTAIEYTDAQCSSQSTVSDGEGKLLRTEMWTRDDKNNPEYIRAPMYYQHEHNRTAVEVKNADMTPDAKRTYSSENRVYNEYGYPVSVTVKYLDGRSDLITYEYLCK